MIYVVAVLFFCENEHEDVEIEVPHTPYMTCGVVRCVHSKKRQYPIFLFFSQVENEDMQYEAENEHTRYDFQNPKYISNKMEFSDIMKKFRIELEKVKTKFI